MTEAKGGGDSIQEACADEKEGDGCLGAASACGMSREGADPCPRVVCKSPRLPSQHHSRSSLIPFLFSCSISSFSSVYKLFNLNQRTSAFP